MFRSFAEEASSNRELRFSTKDLIHKTKALMQMFTDNWTRLANSARREEAVDTSLDILEAVMQKAWSLKRVGWWWRDGRVVDMVVLFVVNGRWLKMRERT
jgi:hypothetical protein